MFPAIFGKQKVRVLAVLSAASLATAVAMFGTTGTAHAAQAIPATPGQYCGTQDSGVTGFYGHTTGTTWSKHPGCNDLNVVYTSTPAPGHWDHYWGQYWSGGWHGCRAGAQLLYNGTHDPLNNPRAVLCTQVLNGTTIAVDETRGYVDQVTLND